MLNVRIWINKDHLQEIKHDGRFWSQIHRSKVLNVQVLYMLNVLESTCRWEIISNSKRSKHFVSKKWKLCKWFRTACSWFNSQGRDWSIRCVKDQNSLTKICSTCIVVLLVFSICLCMMFIVLQVISCLYRSVNCLLLLTVLNKLAFDCIVIV